MSELKQHLEITDLPQDSLGILYGVRKPLVNIFNKCREYPYKMTLLKQFLKFMYNQCVAFEKHNEQVIADTAKVAEIAGKAALIADSGTKSNEISKTDLKETK